MNTLRFFTALLVTAVSATVGFAQEDPAVPAATNPAPQAAVAINGYVYVEKLPTPTQLVSDAEAEKLTVTRMDQTADQIVVVYQYPDGRSRAFGYTTSTPGQAPLVTPASTSTATYTVVSAPPAESTTVVHTSPRVYYRSEPRYIRYYEPAWDFWAPLVIGVGLGWHFNGHHGHHHGGWRHHGGYRPHTGWRR